MIGGSADEDKVAGLLADVHRATEDHPACRLRGPSRRPAELSELPPSTTARRAFPALRRPPTANERRLGRKLGRLPGSRVLGGGARELRAENGTRFAIVIGTGPQGFGGHDAECLPVRRATLERRAADADPAALTEARRVLAREETQLRANLGREGLLFAQLRPEGRLANAGGTFVDAALQSGIGSIGSERRNGRRRTGVTGLVPATVDHVLVRRRGGRSPRPEPIRVGTPQKVSHVTLPEGFGNRIAVEWRTPTGRLIRTLRLGY